MQVPMEVTFRDIPKSQPVEDLVRQLATKLERYCDHIDRCRVVLERPHRHATSGSDYRVLIDLLIPPGHEVVVSWEPGKSSVNDDLYKVVHDAFQAAGRRVKKLAAQRRGHVKVHSHQQIGGVVTRVFDDYGFIEAVDGHEVYFHRNSVLGRGFEALKVGTGVAFDEDTGDRGPQASSVRIVDGRGNLRNGD